MPPVRRPTASSSGTSRYSQEDERVHIADRVREKVSVREIARELGRAPSTISREIRRNWHPTNGRYRPRAGGEVVLQPVQVEPARRSPPTRE
ncbi:helix-turn-helix domain-containing protein [Nonomuraea sp. NPDC005692]|uniref:helix-turn-helix domain-containing protein n=1 Tax=Nonomuraea sp. NPDC005692 TaxID=3157168 RepID=UPI00340A9C9F